MKFTMMLEHGERNTDLQCSNEFEAGEHVRRLFKGLIILKPNYERRGHWGNKYRHFFRRGANNSRNIRNDEVIIKREENALAPQVRRQKDELGKEISRFLGFFAAVSASSSCNC